MENSEKIQNFAENIEPVKKNPNSIGELLSIGRDLLTSPNSVYRSVRGEEALNDLNQSGIVRNKQSAGLVEKSRWGERVFWSKGGEGKYHPVSPGSYVLEAPFSIAQERIVTKEDLTGIYTKNEQGEVLNTLDQDRLQEARESEKRKIKDQEDLIRVKRKLGL